MYAEYGGVKRILRNNGIGEKKICHTIDNLGIHIMYLGLCDRQRDIHIHTYTMTYLACFVKSSLGLSQIVDRNRGRPQIVTFKSASIIGIVSEENSHN